MKIETIKRFYDHVTQSGLCPVVAASMKSGPPCFQCSCSGYTVPDYGCPQCPDYNSHAMVVDSAMSSGSVRYYQCKNTYPNDQRVLVCPNWNSVQADPLRFEYIYDAISIIFSKK